MPAGLASLVLQTQAFFTLLFAAVTLGEKLRSTQIAGMAVAFMGIGLLIAQADRGSPVLALVLVITAAACWGVANIIMKQAKSPDVFRLIVWVSVVPPLPLVLLSWLFEGSDQITTALTHLSWQGLSALAYISFLSTIVGFGIWGALLKRYPANLVAPFTLLVPFFGLLSAALVLHERVTPIQGMSGLLVLAGLVLNLRRDWPKTARRVR